MQLVAELLFRLLQVQHQQRLVNALVANTGTLLGFGFSQPGIALTGGTSITLALGVGDYAFVAPRDGVITSLAGFFSATAALAPLSPVQVQIQILTAPAKKQYVYSTRRTSIINTSICFNSNWFYSIRNHT